MFTLRKLAMKNIRHQKFVSTIMFFLLFITSIGTFVGGLLNYSMKEGLKTTIERIGADIIVVPDKFVTNVEDSLFQGKPCTVNFDAKWKDKIETVEGIKQTSTQLYLASVGALDCCDSTVQMIAFDIKTDFVVGPWMLEEGITSLQKNDIIIGCNIDKKIGDTIKYFGRQFKVKKVLEETGMGYDNCAFVSYETAYQIAEDPSYARVLPFSKKENVISMVLIDVADGYQVSKVSEAIQNKFANSDSSVYETTSLIDNVTSSLERFQIFGILSESMLLMITMVSLFAVITITISLRKNEIGSFLSVGISKEKITRMLVWEYGFIVLGAALTGIILTVLIVLPFHTNIREVLNVPYRMASIPVLLTLGIKTIFIDGIVCAIASLYSFYRIKKYNPADMVKEVNG